MGDNSFDQLRLLYIFSLCFNKLYNPFKDLACTKNFEQPKH